MEISGSCLISAFSVKNIKKSSVFSNAATENFSLYGEPREAIQINFSENIMPSVYLQILHSAPKLQTLIFAYVTGNNFLFQKNYGKKRAKDF